MKGFKKILLIMMVLFSTVMLTSCNDTVPNDGSVTLYLSDSFQEHIEYDNIPSFTLNFDGTLNTIKNVKKTYYTVFSNNDDIILSNAIKELLEEYKDSVEYVVVNVDEVSSRKFSQIKENGKLENISMPCDDKKVYDEVAYIPLDNGLKLTIDYCRFVSNGETYYTWRYSQSIAMYLYYPLMKIKNEGEVELVLLTLPNKVSLHVGPELKLSKLLSKDEYYKSSFYSFSYPNDSKDELSVKKAGVREYYQDYNYNEIDDNCFTFEYLNNKFKVKLEETSFTIEWIERI